MWGRIEAGGILAARQVESSTTASSLAVRAGDLYRLKGLCGLSGFQAATRCFEDQLDGERFVSGYTDAVVSAKFMSGIGLTSHEQAQGRRLLYSVRLEFMVLQMKEEAFVKRVFASLKRQSSAETFISNYWKSRIHHEAEQLIM
jgi:hypothetical protein